MKYTNPIIAGMYPDPSICKVEDTYYLINSSFEYFPGIPVFESKDLLNWTQIGNCLTGESWKMLENSPCSGGVFAPVIRWNAGKFYIITTCLDGEGIHNFFISSDRPDGNWSEPIYFEADGIDPSLFWEDERVYVQYTSVQGKILQIEINIETGEIIRGPEVLTTGCGGRDVEGPHLWKKNEYYYLMVAEGGTREGHMENLLRGKSVWGPFEESPYNPVISNKDLGREPIQCVGHADWIVGPDGNDYLVTLGTRPCKHKTIIGRETMLTPAYWTEDGWLRSKYGYMPIEWEGNLGIQRQQRKELNLEMDSNQMPSWIISPRCENRDSYKYIDGKLIIKGNGDTLEDGKSSFWAVRQSSLNFKLNLGFQFSPVSKDDEAGLVMLAAQNYHISIFCTIRSSERVIVLRKRVADITEEIVKKIETPENVPFQLSIVGKEKEYEFWYQEKKIGTSLQKHLSVECAETPNTGVVGGFFVSGNEKANINEFSYVNE